MEHWVIAYSFGRVVATTLLCVVLVVSPNPPEVENIEKVVINVATK